MQRDYSFKNKMYLTRCFIQMQSAGRNIKHVYMAIKAPKSTSERSGMI